MRRSYKARMDYIVRIVCTLMAVLCLVLMTSALFDEPVCNSRFDYEFKVVQKLASLEEKQTKLERKIRKQRLEIDSLEQGLKRLKVKQEWQASAKKDGSVYTRWGRTHCPENGTHTVYHGYAGGSYYDHSGSGTNFLCLPSDPSWGQFKDGIDEYSARIYGVEYEYVPDERKQETFFDQDLDQGDAPCAVCNSVRASVLMIPGRIDCYPGWTLEYKGYLMSGYYNKAASEYICVDEQSEVIDGGYENTDGKLLYFTEIVCGTLRCPPYIEGRELACVVCSR